MQHSSSLNKSPATTTPTATTQQLTRPKTAGVLKPSSISQGALFQTAAAVQEQTTPKNHFHNFDQANLDNQVFQSKAQQMDPHSNNDRNSGALPGGPSSQNHKMQFSASDPTFSLNVVSVSRRPFSAVKPRTGGTAASSQEPGSAVAGQHGEAPLPPLLSQMKPTQNPHLSHLRRPGHQQARVASAAITRGAGSIGALADARSISAASTYQLQAAAANKKKTAKSSVGAKSTKGGTGVGKPSKGKKNMALAKKISKNHKYVTQHIDNFVPVQQPPLPRPRPGSAVVAGAGVSLTKTLTVAAATQQQQQAPNGVNFQQPPRFPMEEDLGQEILNDLGRKSKKNNEPIVYQVHNYFGGWNNHNYNQGDGNNYSATDNHQSQETPPSNPKMMAGEQQRNTWAGGQLGPPQDPSSQQHHFEPLATTQQQQANAPVILARNQPPSAQSQLQLGPSASAPSINFGQHHQQLQQQFATMAPTLTTAQQSQQQWSQMLEPHQMPSQSHQQLLATTDASSVTPQQRKKQLMLAKHHQAQPRRPFSTKLQQNTMKIPVRPATSSGALRRAGLMQSHSIDGDNNEQLTDSDMNDKSGMSYERITVNQHQRSFSVDTDDFIRHLKSKSYAHPQFEEYQDLHQNQNLENLRNLSKLERQLYVMEFMQNAGRPAYSNQRIQDLLNFKAERQTSKTRELLSHITTAMADNQPGNNKWKLRKRRGDRLDHHRDLTGSDEDVGGYLAKKKSRNPIKKMIRYKTQSAFDDGYRTNDQQQSNQFSHIINQQSKVKMSEQQRRLLHQHKRGSKGFTHSAESKSKSKSRSPNRPTQHTFQPSSAKATKTIRSLRGHPLAQSLGLKTMAQIKKYSEGVKKPREVKKFIEGAESKPKRSKSRQRHRQAMKQASTTKEVDSTLSDNDSFNRTAKKHKRLKELLLLAEKQTQARQPVLERLSPSRIEEDTELIGSTQKGQIEIDDDNDVDVNDRDESLREGAHEESNSQLMFNESSQEMALVLMQLQAQIKKLEERDRFKELALVQKKQRQQAHMSPPIAQQPALLYDQSDEALAKVPVEGQKSHARQCQELLEKLTALQMIQSNHLREDQEPLTEQASISQDGKQSVVSSHHHHHSSEARNETETLTSQKFQKQPSGTTSSLNTDTEFAMDSKIRSNFVSSSMAELTPKSNRAPATNNATAANKPTEVPKNKQSGGALFSNLHEQMIAEEKKECGEDDGAEQMTEFLKGAARVESSKSNYNDDQGLNVQSSARQSDHDRQPDREARENQNEVSAVNANKLSLPPQRNQPLLKMRTAVWNGSKKDLTRSIDNHQLENVGCPVLSEQQNSVYQKAESSANHKTSLMQTVQAISVNQIPEALAFEAKEAAQESSQVRREQTCSEVPDQDEESESHHKPQSPTQSQLILSKDSCEVPHVSPPTSNFDDGQGKKNDQDNNSSGSFKEESLRESQQEELSVKSAKEEDEKSDSQRSLEARFEAISKRMSNQRQQRQASDTGKPSANSQPTAQTSEIGIQTQVEELRIAVENTQITTDVVQLRQGSELHPINEEQSLMTDSPASPQHFATQQQQRQQREKQSTFVDQVDAHMVARQLLQQLQNSTTTTTTQQAAQPQVIVRSPFEQEIMEALAVAATRPRTTLRYLPELGCPSLLYNQSQTLQLPLDKLADKPADKPTDKPAQVVKFDLDHQRANRSADKASRQDDGGADQDFISQGPVSKSQRFIDDFCFKEQQINIFREMLSDNDVEEQLVCADDEKVTLYLTNRRTQLQHQDIRCDDESDQGPEQRGGDQDQESLVESDRLSTDRGGRNDNFKYDHNKLKLTIEDHDYNVQELCWPMKKKRNAQLKKKVLSERGLDDLILGEEPDDNDNQQFFQTLPGKLGTNSLKQQSTVHLRLPTDTNSQQMFQATTGQQHNPESTGSQNSPMTAVFAQTSSEELGASLSSPQNTNPMLQGGNLMINTAKVPDGQQNHKAPQKSAFGNYKMQAVTGAEDKVQSYKIPDRMQTGALIFQQQQSERLSYPQRSPFEARNSTQTVNNRHMPPRMMNKGSSMDIFLVQSKIDPLLQRTQEQTTNLLRRQATIAMTELGLGDEFETVFAKYNKQVEQGKVKLDGDVDSEVSHDLSQAEDSIIESEAIYWGLEVDEFHFTHMYTSIVDRVTMTKLETKILMQANWSGKKTAKALTRLDSIRLGINESRASSIIQPIVRETGLNMPISRITGMMPMTGRGESSSVTPSTSPQQQKPRRNSLLMTALQQKQMSYSRSLERNSDEKLRHFPMMRKSMSLIQIGDAVSESNFDWLEKEYPMPNIDEVKALYKVYSHKENIQIEVCIDLPKLEELQNQSMAQQPSTQLNRRNDSSQTIKSSNYTRIGTNAASSYQHSKKVHRMSLHQSSQGNNLYGNNNEAIMFLSFRVNSNEEFQAILKAIEEIMTCTAPKDIKKFNSLYENEHFMQNDLFTKFGLTTFQELKVQLPMSEILFEKNYIDYLQQLINEEGYMGYSKHLWNISQLTKERYVNQGDRARRFFKSSRNHNPRCIGGIISTAQSQIAAYMRRSTIRQEINDTLSQKTTQLLFDERYVKPEMRPILIEKIKLTIEKTCFAENAYQYHLRMQELNQLHKYAPNLNSQQKRREFCQFSRMLVFINFHPPGEGKRWIHQDYMDSLKKLDLNTPRFYASTTDPLLSKSHERVPISKMMTTLALPNAMNSLTLAPKPGVATLNSARDRSGGLKLPGGGKYEQKPFPFKLNDEFGYCTIILTDGCYQIITPQRPPTRYYRKGHRGSLDHLRTMSAVNVSPFLLQPLHDATFTLNNSPSNDASPNNNFGDTSFGNNRRPSSNNLIGGLATTFSGAKNRSPPELQGKGGTSTNAFFGSPKVYNDYTSPSRKASANLLQSESSPALGLTPYIGDTQTYLARKLGSRAANIDDSIKSDKVAPPPLDGEGTASSQQQKMVESQIIKLDFKNLQQQKSSETRREESPSGDNNNHVCDYENSCESGFSFDFSEEEKYFKQASIDHPKHLLLQQKCSHLQPSRKASLIQLGNSPYKRARNTRDYSSEDASPVYQDSPVGRFSAGKVGGNFTDHNFMYAIQNYKKFKMLSTEQSPDDKRAQNRRQGKSPSTTEFHNLLAKANTLGLEADMFKKKQKVVKHNNIKVQKIVSFEQLSEMRLEKSTQKRLYNMGLSKHNRRSAGGGQGGTNNLYAMNSSMLTANTAQSASSPSPTNQPAGAQQKRYPRYIGIVKPVRKVEEKEEDRSINNRGAIPSSNKNPILLDPGNKKINKAPQTNLAQQIIRLRSLAVQKKADEKAAEEEKKLLEEVEKSKQVASAKNGENVDESTSPKPPNQSGGKTITSRLASGIFEAIQEFKDKRKAREKVDFVKFQLNKSSASKPMLMLKRPETRIREKKEYEAALEQEERNKVFHAIEFNQIQVVEAYLKTHMLGTDVVDVYGNTLLSIAAQFGCYDICDLLIKEGADVNTQNKLGNTPLHYAICYNMSNICDLLIESGAKETIKNKKRITPWQGI